MPITSQENSEVGKCRIRYSSGEEFLKTFNPGLQAKFCKDIKRCFTGTAPSLKILSEAFGDEVTESWVAIQLRDLSEFSGCKDKLSVEQVDQLAKVISMMFPYLKVTELMYFFFLFKSGKYGRFYGSVDGLTITEALQDFRIERRELLQQYGRENHKTEQPLQPEDADRRMQDSINAAYKDFLSGCEKITNSKLQKRVEACRTGYLMQTKMMPNNCTTARQAFAHFKAENRISIY